MKNYILKLIIFFAVLFLFFEFTIGKRLDKFENTVNSFKNNEQRIQIKEKIKIELKKGIEKENYFDEEERYLISTFLKKLAKELSLNN
tara:strand:+ start:277 stop:540 length:264 start_codon:yes stop_codon:yes gene_type:complete